MSDSIKDEGIVIKNVDFREIDKKVDILLSNGTIVTAIAYGAKKSKKRFGGNLDPYNIGMFELQKTKNYYYIKETTTKKIFTKIKQNILTLNMLFNITKLLTSKPLDIHRDIYKALSKMLIKLEQESNMENAMKYYLFFLIYFLKKEGLITQIKCYNCGTDNVQRIAFDNNNLLFSCKNCSEFNSLYIYSVEGISFIKTCLNADKNFSNKYYSLPILQNIEFLLIDYIEKHFCIKLDRINV